MRGALVLAAVLLAGLLALAPALAAAEEVERDVGFSMEVEGFNVRVLVDNNDGDVQAMVFISRGPLIAQYVAPAQVSADRVTAEFGAFGELDYRFAPKRNGRIECDYAEEGEAVFEGIFRFTGENGYIHVEAPSAEGSYRISPASKACPRKRLASRVVPNSRVVPYSPTYSGPGATLVARASSNAKGPLRELTVYDAGEAGPYRVAVFAFLAERHRGVSSARGVERVIGAAAFRWNFQRGTATLRPPAPFTGSASFTRRGSKSHGTWKGSLRMPILGGDPVRLAGREFRSFIHKGVPQPR